METSFQDLLKRLDQLSTQQQELRIGIRQAITIAEQDPEMSLTRARKLLEYVVRQVYQGRVKEEPGTRPLENLLQRLVKDGYFPKRLAAYANTVRELGNVGTHGFDEGVTAADVLQSLTQLLPIFEWYFEQEKTMKAPPTNAAYAAAVPLAAIPQGAGEYTVRPLAVASSNPVPAQAAGMAKSPVPGLPPALGEPARPPRRWRWLWIGAGSATALAALVIIIVLNNSGPSEDSSSKPKPPPEDKGKGDEGKATDGGSKDPIDLTDERDLPEPSDEVKILIENLTYKDPTVRRMAAEHLAKFKSKGVVAALLKALRDKDGRVGSVAAQSLEKLGDKRAVPGLQIALRDKDGWVRFRAAQSLEKLGDKRAVQALMDRVADDVWIQPDGPVLLSVDSTPYDSIESRSSKVTALHALQKLAPDKVVSALLMALQAKNLHVRAWGCVQFKDHRKDQSVVKALCKALKDVDGRVRFVAAQSLEKLGDKRAVQALMDRVADDVWVQPDGPVLVSVNSLPYDSIESRSSKVTALHALQKLGPEKVKSALSRAARSENSSVRKWALAKLAESKDKK